MWSVTDWLLEKMKLTDDQVEEQDEELDEDVIPWLETIGKKKIAEQDNSKRVFYKTITSYNDAREVIREYRTGIECVITFNQNENPDAQGMMNYLCGAVYALDGIVRDAGANVFVLALRRDEKR